MPESHINYTLPKSPPCNKSRCNSRLERHRVIFDSCSDYCNLIPLRVEPPFMLPPKRIPIHMLSYSQAAIPLPPWTDRVFEFAIASAAPWHYPEEKPGGEQQGHSILEREVAATEMKYAGEHRGDGPSRKSFDHRVSFQKRERSGDPLNSTCHCKIDLCGKRGSEMQNFTLKSTRS